MGDVNPPQHTIASPMQFEAASLRGRRILVVGDVMLDRWMTGSDSRRSPEADCSIFNVAHESDALGGAANVAANVASLGGKAHLIGLYGADAAAEVISRKLAEIDGIAHNLISDTTRCTTVKERAIRAEDKKHLLRLDRETCRPPPAPVLEEFISYSTAAVPDAEVVIFSDYGKGLFDQELFDALATATKKHDIPFLVDPKNHDLSRYNGASVITPNLHELSVAVGHVVQSDERSIERAVKESQTAIPAFCVKLGHLGVQLIQEARTIVRHPSGTSGAVDVSGAGDTLISALALALASGEELARAVDIANVAASLVVQKPHTATVTAAELEQAMAYIALEADETIKLDHIRLARVVASWQQQGLKVGFTNGCFDLIHPGHIRVLKQAKSRVDRLVVAVNSDRSVQKLKGPNRPIQDEASRLEVIAALDSVSVVTLFEEDTPLELIKQIRPEFLFKGGDYKIEEVVGREFVQARGGTVEIIKSVKGQSSTTIIEKSRRDSGKKLLESDASSIDNGVDFLAIRPLNHDVSRDNVIEQISQLAKWLRDIVWPYWLEHGADRDTQGRFLGFREYLSVNETGCNADYRRLLTLSRQIYVFSYATVAGLPGAKGRLHEALDHLKSVARQKDNGYARTFNLEGKTKDRQQDLYDNAFVLLAFSAAMNAMPSDVLRSDALALDQHLQDNFAHRNGGYLEGISATTPRRQNSHMHLLEAYLAATGSFGPEPYLDRADALVELFHTKLWQPCDRAVPEHFDEEWSPCREDGRYVLEPGHLASWCWLLDWHHSLIQLHKRPVRFEHKTVIAEVMSLLDEHSLQSHSYAIPNVVRSDGSVVDPGLRLWPQLERLKAEFLRSVSTHEQILDAIRVIREFSDEAPVGLWVERRGDLPSDGIAPATSLYHLTNSIMFASQRLKIPIAFEHTQLSLSSLAAKRPVLVTGGAGFIGSNLVTALNAAGYHHVIVCDDLGQDGKWKNLRYAAIDDIVHPRNLFDWLDEHQEIGSILHFGAISSTTSIDADQVIDANFRFSVRLLDWCTAHEVKFIYASSAATYGAGTAGYNDDMSSTYLQTLKPLNLYGWSKHLFDRLVSKRAEAQDKLPPICIGLKLFNVFGPNEGHKGHMMSLVSKNFDKIKSGETIDLFRSHHADYQDGCQSRDFVYVRDIERVVLWLLSREQGVALYNVGSGESLTFQDLLGAVFDTLGLERRIRYVDMPMELRANYQYHTKADLSSLRRDGYERLMTSLEEAVADLVHGYLDRKDYWRSSPGKIRVHSHFLHIGLRDARCYCTDTQSNTYAEAIFT